MVPIFRLADALVAVVLAFFLGYDPAAADKMLVRLGSASFTERQAADAWLRERPETAPLLRRAMQQSDLETRRRAQGILQFHAAKRAKAVETAVDAGNIEKAIRLISTWPKGEGEEEAWAQTWRLSTKIMALCKRKKGDPILWDLMPAWEKSEQEVVTDGFRFDRSQNMILYSRGREAIWRGPKERLESMRICLAVAGDVEIAPARAMFFQWAVFAGGQVKISKSRVICSVIVSCGDVHLDELGDCIVIARGKITADMAIGCHLISGQTVSLKNGSARCLISENDSNPLGFIRWSDTPKQKDAAKAKDADKKK